MKSEVWGLTGGVASGKSTAARLFEEAGIKVIDADRISRELSSPGGGAHDAIVRRFGTADRARLRELVFANTEARKDLEAILHPLIQAESQRRMAGGGPVIYEAALLVETGRWRDFAGLIVVEARPELRRQRLIARDRIEEALAEKMIQSQLSDAERRECATVVWENSGDLSELRTRVKDFLAARGWG